MSKPPLWRYMQAARHNRPLAADSASAEANAPLYAAEICALRDRLVPEEAPPLGPAGKQNMHLRALLTTEADRAEQGALDKNARPYC